MNRPSGTEDKSIYCTYLGHSGFMIEMPEATLLFDWYQGDLPDLRADKPLYIFISHVHADHFKQAALEIALQLSRVKIFLGYDNSVKELNEALAQFPPRIQGALKIVGGGQRLSALNGEWVVETLTSTDMGVAYLVEIGGKTFFHAGDLFLMQTISEADYMKWYTQMMAGPHAGKHIETYKEHLKHQEKRFAEFTEPLRKKTIDYGMIPLDPRFEDIGYLTVKRYMKIADFKVWSPMHLWGKYDFVDDFIEAHPEYGENMIAFTKRTQPMKRIHVGVRFRLFGPNGEVDGARTSNVCPQGVSEFERASEMFNIGYSYYDGVGVKRDIGKAIEWFKKAAELNHPRAMFLLGSCYYNGTGMNKDYDRALDWLTKAAQLGDAKAMNRLGYMYECGHGTRKDFAEAMKWYEKSSDRGNPDATFKIGLLYYNGNGVARSYEEAMKWLRKAAQLGHSDAMHWTAFMYEKGYGADKDLGKALKWYQTAASCGKANSMFRTGLMYYNGGDGVEKNYGKALEWFMKSIGQATCMKTDLEQLRTFPGRWRGIRKRPRWKMTAQKRMLSDLGAK